MFSSNNQANHSHFIVDEAPVFQQEYQHSAPQSAPQSAAAAIAPAPAAGASEKRKRRRSSRGAIPTGSFAPFRRTVTPDDLYFEPKKPRSLQCPNDDDAIIITTSTTTAATNATQKKSVDFADNVSAIIPQDFSTADQWYNRQDYSEFKVNVKKDVMHLAVMAQCESLKKLDFNEHSVVGIEKYCCSGAQQDNTRNARAQLVQTVMNQQSLQKVLGTRDDEMIRMLCQFHSQESCQKAQERAQAFR